MISTTDAVGRRSGRDSVSFSVVLSDEATQKNLSRKTIARLEAAKEAGALGGGHAGKIDPWRARGQKAAVAVAQILREVTSGTADLDDSSEQLNPLEEGDGPWHQFRRLVRQLVEGKWFHLLVYLTIVVSSVQVGRS